MQTERVNVSAAPLELEVAAPAQAGTAPVAIEAEAAAGAMLELVEQGAAARARVECGSMLTSAAPVWAAPTRNPERLRLERRISVALTVASAASVVSAVGGLATIFVSRSTGLILGSVACAGFLVMLSAVYLIASAMRALRKAPLSIGAWHDGLQLPVPRYGRGAGASERLRMFSTWLDKLPEAGDYMRDATRQAFLTRVRDVLSSVNADPVLRERVFDIAAEASTACGDRTAWGLNAMEMAVLTRRAEQGELAEHALFALGRGSFRLDALERVGSAELASRRAAGGLMHHEPEVLLDLQSSLRERLALPLGNQHVRFSSHLRPEEIEQAAAAVLTEESRVDAQAALLDVTAQGLRLYQRSAPPLPALEKHPLARYLAQDFKPWAEQFARADPPLVDEIKNAARGYLDRLEDALAEGSVSEADYVRAANEAGFMHDHGPAYRRALEMICEGPATPPTAG